MLIILKKNQLDGDYNLNKDYIESYELWVIWIRRTTDSRYLEIEGELWIVGNVGYHGYGNQVYSAISKYLEIARNYVKSNTK